MRRSFPAAWRQFLSDASSYASPCTRQNGAAMLAAMLVLLATASFLLVSNLNAKVRRYERQADTAKVLAEAKIALLAYSVSYPERHPGKGPGFLPCPDRNNNGSASGNCSFAGRTTIGRFPWKTVQAGDFRDHHGERLWYVVSDNFRTPPKTRINSDTPGDLSVDARDDVVAVIFAPGAPVAGQDRAAGPLDAGNYLDGPNADGDKRFGSTLPDGNGDEMGVFNDQLVAVTRKELMQAIEKRALGDVSEALKWYRGAYGAFPWLSPFADPSLSSFKSEAGRHRGHLPFHTSGDLSGATNRNPFLASVRWSWHVDLGTATGSYSGTVTADCLSNVDCSDGLFPLVGSVDATITCTWIDRFTASCGPSDWLATTTIPCEMGCTGMCTREYRVAFPLYAGTVTINPPSPAAGRTRDVELSGRLPPYSRAVEIRDTYAGPTNPPDCSNGTAQQIGAGHMNFTAATTGIIRTAGIKYDLDVDNDEIPGWLVANGWHELVYVAYAPEDLTGGPASACAADPSESAIPCLVVEGSTAPRQNATALVLMAGDTLKDIAGTGPAGAGQSRPSWQLADYFEGMNASAGDVFQRQAGSADFNDQLRIVAEVGP